MARRKPQQRQHRTASFGQLAKELHAQSERDIRQGILRAHARRLVSETRARGKIMTCRLSFAEERGEVMNVGSEHKVIYDTWTDASRAARELLDHEIGRQYPYPCPRTADGHHHLTSRPPWRRFDVPGLHKTLELPTIPSTLEEVEQALSYELTRQQRRPPGDLMVTNDDGVIHAWYVGEIARRWKTTKKEKD